MDLLDSYSGGIYCFSRRVDHGLVSPLSQNRGERILCTSSISQNLSPFLPAYILLKGYPDEWFPSVSATIGDRYPERSVFQLFIAMTSGRLSDLELSKKIVLTVTCRSSVCFSIPLVHFDSAPRFGPTSFCGRHRPVPYADVWWMDIRDFYR